MDSRISRIDRESELYPKKLREIDDSPPQLYCIGDLSLLNETSIAMVGSRKFTMYGKSVAKTFGRLLSKAGFPIVSGLAAGIDSYSHIGALEGGGRPIGVLAGGFDHFYPQKNTALINKVAEKGLLISEYEPDFTPKKWSFPRRNRIISGLSSAVVIIEANYNSGALITAQHALDQGVPVYAVPGNINSQFSMGTNLLLRDGAIPLVVVDDIVNALGGSLSASVPDNTAVSETEKIVLEAVHTHNGCSSDELSKAVGKSVGTVNATVTVLEIKGLVSTCAGKIYLAKQNYRGYSKCP